jgi:hypothetical protein
MKKLISSALFGLIISLVALVDTSTVSAQLKQQKPRVSPSERVSAVIDKTNRVTVIYGRPYTKDAKSGQNRKIWGGLVPYGKVWRLGSDEATYLVTQQPIKMGDTIVPVGTHSLYLLPEENGPTKLIINKQLGQWGLTYDEKQDLARIDMKKESLATPVDQFTMAINGTPGGGGMLGLMWDTMQFSVPFTTQK